VLTVIVCDGVILVLLKPNNVSVQMPGFLLLKKFDHHDDVIITRCYKTLRVLSFITYRLDIDMLFYKDI
jgi:hypothetical protein